MKFDCFYNEIKRERLIAKMSNINYYILKAQQNRNTSAVEILSRYKEKYKNKILKDFEEISLLVSKYNSGAEISSNELSKINKIKTKYKNLNRIFDFQPRFLATYHSVKDGKEVSFYNIPSNITKDLDFIFSTDLIVNLIGLGDLDEDLFSLYYAGGITKNDMPVFVSKALKSKYDNFILEKTQKQPIEFRSLEGNFKKLYITERNEHKQKELYEAVFPEFNLKYEDRNSEEAKIFTMDWDNKK